MYSNSRGYFFSTMDCLQFEDFELEGGGVISRETSEDPDPFVEFSVKIINVLDGKVSTHNQEHPSDKVFLSQLKQIYIDTASSRPDDWAEKINEWALARVNMFLRIKANKKIIVGKLKEAKNGKLTKLEFESEGSDNLIGEEIDATKEWAPIEEDFERSKKDIDKYNLNFIFSSINELYIENQEGPISIDFR